jgi:hypothetical protein
MQPSGCCSFDKMLRSSSIALVVLVLIGTGGTRADDTTVIARIGGSTVTRGELELALGSWMPRIQQVRSSGAAASADSITSYVEHALDDAMRCKLQELLALRHNIIRDASYRGFLRDYDAENAGRERAQREGKIVYGPTSFTLPAYYHYRLSQLALRTREILAASDIPDFRLHACYDSLRATQFRLRDSVTILVLSTRDGSKQHLKEAASSFADAAGTDVGIPGCTVKVRGISGTNYNSISEEDPLVAQTAYALHPGSISGWLLRDGEWTLVRVVDRRAQGFMSWEEARGIVRSRLVEMEYEHTLTALRDGATVEVDSLALLTFIKHLAGNDQ